MPASWSPAPLILPFRFGTVESEVYRGAYPKQRNLRFLKRLKLRTILSLIPDAPDAGFQEFCIQQGIRSIHLPVDKVKDNVPLTYNRAVEAVQIIIDQENLPIYIHCLDGASVTGLVICCLRKLQTWNVSSALGEFLRYLRGGVISSEESGFVEKFSSEIEISKPIPSWLWEGQVTFKKHPTLKLNFTIPPAAAASSNATNTSTSSPTIPNQSVMAVFPSHPGDVTNHGSGATGAMNGSNEMLANGDIMNSISNQGLIGLANAQVGSSSQSPTNGLQSHATRSAVKAIPFRDRINNKAIVRTDIQGYTSRMNTIATPITAALSKNKRALQSTFDNSTQHNSQASTQDYTSADVSTTSDIGASSTNLPVQASRSITSSNPTAPSMSGSNPDLSAAVPITNILHNKPGGAQSQSGEHGPNTGGDGPAGKEGGPNAGQKPAEGSSDNLPQLGQDRNAVAVNKILLATLAAQAPTPAEVADEYYEVSMTLKALALEGADF
ncbi:hypothetical protein BGZ76_011449 [Entomortierella beljakovae]|nr:hypothetical protein BGZ76_011449 [Entomortierella beljakovae]